MKKYLIILVAVFGLCFSDTTSCKIEAAANSTATVASRYWVTCGTCNGSGNSREWKTCNYCGGRGVLNGKTCSMCSGEGGYYVKVIGGCRPCKGRGGWYEER